MPAMIVPRTVEPDAAGRALRLVWADGHQSAISYETLRGNCPCSKCRDAREQGRKPLVMALATKLLSWKRIGNYALNIEWGDSHSEGIYAYDFLRRLCPCGACG